MHKFQAELERLTDSTWKVSWLLPQPQDDVMGSKLSPAGLDDNAAKTWAKSVLIGEGFLEQFGWSLDEKGNFVMGMTV